MLDRLLKYDSHVRFYEAPDIPLKRDSFLISNENLSQIETQWMEFFSSTYNYNTWKHPNELMDYIPCHISYVNEDYLNVTLLLDRTNRFHTISKTLPLKYFKTAFLVFSAEKRPYIVVDHVWFNKIKSSIYSAYVLIDFVGVRDLLHQFGEFPSQKLDSVKRIVDDFARQNKELTFLTCADNIILKSGWAYDHQSSSYHPEKLIKTVHDLMTRIEDETQIKSYSIFTQGANYVDERSIAMSHSPSNHYFISSISVPFIEAFEIDNDIRKRLRRNEIERESFYIEQSFYVSTKRRFFGSDEPRWFRKVSFQCEKLKTDLTYSPVSYDNICTLIDMNFDNN